MAFIWADWQSCGDDGAELLDPVRSQYKESFVVVRCRYDGQLYSRCVFIWVDKDFALVRGYLQGYPKKLGSIHQTRPVTVGRPVRASKPAARFGMTLAAADRRLANATVTLDGPAASNGFVNGHAMLHHRWFPRIELDGVDALDEVVTMSGVDLDLGPVWGGTATLELFDSPERRTVALWHPARSSAGTFAPWARPSPVARRCARANEPAHRSASPAVVLQAEKDIKARLKGPALRLHGDERRLQRLPRRHGGAQSHGARRSSPSTTSAGSPSRCCGSCGSGASKRPATWPKRPASPRGR